MLQCTRAGVTRFIIEAAPPERARIENTLERLPTGPQVTFVESIQQLAERPEVNLSAPCIVFSGNLVLAQSHLRTIIDSHESSPHRTIRMVSTDREHGGSITVGVLANLLGDYSKADGTPVASDRLLPFALNGRPEDRDEAELRLARSVRIESRHTDAPMARILDRRLSWRLSFRLARLGISPNVVTLANTALGLVSAAMFASVDYWMRLGGALLFLLCITLDGVDGELARLRMVESETGARLDVITDNIVHVAVFIGLVVGCYRLSHSAAYFVLLAILLGGFLCCAISVNRALSVRSADAERWLGRVERATGRDFAYVLVVLAALNLLPVFVWGTAFGTYLFAFCLWWLTDKREQPARMSERHGTEYSAREGM